MGAPLRAGAGRGVGVSAPALPRPAWSTSAPRPAPGCSREQHSQTAARHVRDMLHSLRPAGPEIIAVPWAGNGRWRASPRLPRQRAMRSEIVPRSTAGRITPDVSPCSGSIPRDASSCRTILNRCTVWGCKVFRRSASDFSAHIVPCPAGLN